ncbi:hypothetical protein BD413DRAFT_597196 [Trametes elegans]|nr:hypothetical protein BD413DRAFT_597196 [Trametes elegans]
MVILTPNLILVAQVSTSQTSDPHIHSGPAVNTRTQGRLSEVEAFSGRTVEAAANGISRSYEFTGKLESSSCAPAGACDEGSLRLCTIVAMAVGISKTGFFRTHMRRARS